MLEFPVAHRPRRAPPARRLTTLPLLALAAALCVAWPPVGSSLAAQERPAAERSAPEHVAGPGQPPSVALPAELARVLRDYERGWRAGDPAAVSRLFAEDGMALPSGKPPAVGRAAIARAYAGQGGALRLRALAYAVADSVGYIIGGYRWGPGDGDVGKFVLALTRRAGGAWMIAADIDNANAPDR